MPNDRFHGKLPLKKEPRSGRLARGLSAVSSFFGNAKRKVFERPWMSLAVTASVALPIGIALLPLDSAGKSKSETALDERPIPSKIEIHGDDALPMPVVAGEVHVSAAPRTLDAGWEDAPAWPGSPAARQAAYRDDIEAPGGVQTVGSNRPAVARPRGAWLTGGIEETPEASVETPAKYRSTGRSNSY